MGGAAVKVLFVGPTSPDHLASCLHDGLQEVLGEQNVIDAVDSAWLHASSLSKLYEQQGADFPMMLQAIAGAREGCRLKAIEKGSFDALILVSSFNRDESWDWARAWRDWLKPNGKIAYLEGWDAAWQIEQPRMPVDAVFRKEISHSVQYPYQPQHLTFAAPSRWFHPDGERPYDVVFIGNPDSIHPRDPELRWRMMRQAFSTRKHHKAVMASRSIGYDLYFELLRKSKLALCPAAADGADSLRTYEVAACGAIPVFVGYPDHRRENWFDGDTAIFCTPNTLAEHLDNALSSNLAPMRESLRQHAMKHETTAARALKVLRALGFDE